MISKDRIPMRNILIIASLYGSKRVLGLARHLPEFGWSPTIITPPVSWQPTIISNTLPEIGGVKIIETGYSGIKEPILRAGVAISKSTSSVVKKLLHFGGAMINYPDSYSSWKIFALQAGREVLDKGDVDVIMSICPVTSHIVASQLKKEYPDVKWICDFPDLWSQNHNYGYGEWRRWLDTRLEIRTLDNVDVITTTSEPRAEQLRELHKGKRVVAITLGYDDKEYEAKAEINMAGTFIITYTGLFYKGKQNPDLMLEALPKLFNYGRLDRRECDVRLYGGKLDWVQDSIDRLSLWDIVHQYGKVSHAEAIKAQKESQLLWLLDWDDPNELGVHPGKIFEYLGARRPILATGGVKGNVVDELIKETQSGYHAIDTQEAEQVLEKCYREWKQTGQVEYHGVGQERFTWREMTRKYVELLE
jgi:glycosyltransferase involved in cell wall biosynthesis